MAKRKRTPAPRIQRPRADSARQQEGFASSWQRKALVWLIVAKIVGVVLIVDTLSVQSFDFPKSLFSRAIAWLMAGVLIAAMLRFGSRIVPRTRIHVLVLGFVGANVLAAIFAENHYVALFGEWKRYLGLTFAVDMAVLYVAVAVAFRTVRDWAKLGAAVGAVVALTVVYAVIQRLGLDPVRWSDDPRARPFATLGQPDIYGQFLSASLGAAIGVALFVRRPTVRAVAVLAALGVIGISALVATRGSAVGMGAALVVAMGFYWSDRRADRGALVRLGVAVGVAAISVAAVVAFTPLGHRLRDTAAGAQVTDRLVIYKSAAQAFAARPILGWGPDGMATAYPRFSQPESVDVLLVNSFLSSAHSWVLQTAVTLGVVGLLTLLALISVASITLVRRLRSDAAIAAPLLLALVAYWAHGLVTVGSISVDWIPWVAFGGAAALSASQEPLPGTRRVGSMTAAAVIGAAAIAALLGSGPWLASHDALSARIAIGTRDGTSAVAAARSAVARDSGRARYWSILGSAYDVQQQWKQAGDAFAEAATREPYDPTNWEHLAVSRTRQAFADPSGGAQNAALDAARRGAEVDRYNSAGYIVQAQVATAFGQFDVAFRSAVTALRLAQRDPSYRDDPNYARVAAQAALGITDLAAARRELEDLAATRESAPLRVAIGQVALKQGDRPLAVLNARRALEIDPANADARALLAAAGG